MSGKSFSRGISNSLRVKDAELSRLSTDFSLSWMKQFSARQGSCWFFFVTNKSKCIWGIEPDRWTPVIGGSAHPSMLFFIFAPQCFGNQGKVRNCYCILLILALEEEKEFISHSIWGKDRTSLEIPPIFNYITFIDKTQLDFIPLCSSNEHFLLLPVPNYFS